MRRPARLAIFVGPKGRGSNMAAILKACSTGCLNAVGALVVSPKPSTDAVETAESFGVPIEVLPSKDEDYARLAESILHRHAVDVICLAGYMRLLPENVLRAYPDRVLNIHPALLPRFGGQGMYGMRVHEAVVAAGEIESGCSVHYVNERYDEGEVIIQRKVALDPGDTAEDVAAKVLVEEHIAYVEALRKVIDALPD